MSTAAVLRRDVSIRLAAAAAAIAVLGAAGPGAAAAGARGARAAMAAAAWIRSELPAGAAPRDSHLLPAAAAGPVSRILGRDEPGYLVSRGAAGLVARNRAQGLTARFTAAGATVRSGAASIGIRLNGFGYGGKLATPPAAAPAAAANRVVYRLGQLAEWYANGPAGLEQGFTIFAGARPAAAARGGWLTLALAVSGASRMRMAGGGVVFSQAGSSVAYRDLVVYDARGRRLPARMSLARGQVLLRADVRGARYPLTVDPVFQQQAILTASDGANDDYLGTSVAIDGSTIVAGAPDATVGGHDDQGAVYVFTEPAAGWGTETQAAKLTASGGASEDSLGTSVAIEGGTVVAGAPDADVSAHADQGAVYVFTEPGGGWGSETQAAELTASDGARSDSLGSSVGVSGGTVVAGAPDATVSANGTQGAAYVFTKPGAGWASQPAETQTAKLTASDGATGEVLGTSVGISGGTVVAGAPDATVSANPDQGAAYVFTEPGGGWASQPAETQSAKLTASDGAEGYELGYSVAVAGGTVVAGAPYQTVGGHTDQGAVYVFTEPGAGWASQPAQTQTAELTASDGASSQYLGYLDVATSGSTIVAGAPYTTIGSAYTQGEVYVFTEPAGGWASETEAARLFASDAAADDYFGYAVGVSGGTVVASAPFAIRGPVSEAGRLYVFGSTHALPPPPHQLTLGRTGLARQGSAWRSGSTVTVTVTLHYLNGPAIPAALAAELAANCDVTIRAGGADTLKALCMRYDGGANGDFSYRWRLGGRAGPVRISVQLSYPAYTSLSWRTMIRR